MTQFFMPYLMVKDASSAIDFYVKVFGAEVIRVMRGDTVPSSDKTPELNDIIIHSELKIKGNCLYLAEATVVDTEGSPKTVLGNNISLLLEFSSEEEQKEIYEGLQEGGNINVALHDAFWGARYAMLTDKFGVAWQLNMQRCR